MLLFAHKCGGILLFDSPFGGFVAQNLHLCYGDLFEEGDCKPTRQMFRNQFDGLRRKSNQIANNATNKLNASLLELRRLFLVENMLDSIKFGLSLWVLTYIGSWFNAMTLILLSWVGLFSIPKVYLNNKTQIDPVLDKVKAQLNEISGKVAAMIPQAKPAEKTE